MTDLTKRVKRRTLAPHRGRRIIVSMLPGDVFSFREERMRKHYLLSIASAFDYAVILEVERRKREKAAERKARR